MITPVTDDKTILSGKTSRTILPPDIESPLADTITMKAIEKARLSLPSNKTPGAHGLPQEFYKTYRPFIGRLFLIMAH